MNDKALTNLRVLYGHRRVSPRLAFDLPKKFCAHNLLHYYFDNDFRCLLFFFAVDFWPGPRTVNWTSRSYNACVKASFAPDAAPQRNARHDAALRRRTSTEASTHPDSGSGGAKTTQHAAEMKPRLISASDVATCRGCARAVNTDSLLDVFYLRQRLGASRANELACTARDATLHCHDMSHG